VQHHFTCCGTGSQSRDKQLEKGRNQGGNKLALCSFLLLHSFPDAFAPVAPPSISWDSLLSTFNCRLLTSSWTLPKKHMEVRCHRLGAKLPHHQRDLTPMVSGMVCQMLHQVRQADLRCAKRKHSRQGFVGHAIHELALFLFNFHPLCLHRRDIGKCLRMEQRVPSCSQIRDEGRAGGRLLPIRQPAPLPTNDVHQRISHRSKAAAQIARKLLIAECADYFQNPVVRPPVVFVQQLNVILIHIGRPPDLCVAGILPCPRASDEIAVSAV
jgi:hypothetical protein